MRPLPLDFRPPPVPLSFSQRPFTLESGTIPVTITASFPHLVVLVIGKTVDQWHVGRRFHFP
jgi:hypothetical protein